MRLSVARGTAEGSPLDVTAWQRSGNERVTLASRLGVTSRRKPDLNDRAPAHGTLGFDAPSVSLDQVLDDCES
jgi:hypothetical protein